MYMRLAFAVAINVDADILLIDEILAVGDASFQAKCFDKLREIKSQGTTIVIVSHSLGQIEQFCDRTIWLHEGKIREEGVPHIVDMKYLDYMGQKREEKKWHESSSLNKKKNNALKKDGSSNGYIENQELEGDIQQKELERKIAILDAHLEVGGKKTSNIRVGSTVSLKLHYKRYKDINNPLMGVKIYRNDNVIVYGINSKNDGFLLDLKEEGYLVLSFSNWNFVQGEYHIDLAIREENMTVCDYKSDIIVFTTYYSIPEDGIAHLEHTWISD